MTAIATDAAPRRGRSDAAGPLAGLRILELGHFVAAPFCTRLLGDLGADVIKVEPPGAGDPVRQWGGRFKGESAWWSVHGRNKRCVTLDLKKPRARELARRLAAPSAPYSGSAPSSRLKIDSVSATSRLRPRPSPPSAASRRHSAAMTPKAA